MIDLTPILQAVVSLVAVAITAYLVPYIKRKGGGEKLAQARNWAEVAVNAAQQMAKSGLIDWDERKRYATDFLEAHGFTVDLDALIEAAVNQLNLEESYAAAEIETGIEYEEAQLQMDENALLSLSLAALKVEAVNVFGLDETEVSALRSKKAVIAAINAANE